MRVAHPTVLVAIAAAGVLTLVARFGTEEPTFEAGVVPADGRRLHQAGTLNATANQAFLPGVTQLYGQASSGCMTCCDSSSCATAYQNSQPGTCCGTAPSPLCCPEGTMCVTSPQVGCSRQQGQPAYGQPAYGQPQPAYGQPAYGQNGGYPQPGYSGYPQLTPFQQLMRFIRDHMMIIWIVLLVLGCLGVGGTHELQQLLCGLSIFNMFAPQSMQNNLYGPPGAGQGGGGYGYPQGAF